MTHNWTKNLLQKWRWLKISKKKYKDIVNGYVYVGKNILIFKIIYDM